MGGSDVIDAFAALGAEVIPFASRHFGAAYPMGNKIEMLRALPEGEPFVFFDSDTLITGDIAQVPFDFARPTASLRREGTWPKPLPDGPGHAAIWKSLYDRFGLSFGPTLDLSHGAADWQRYLYFNAGFFYYRCPHVFGALFEQIATGLRDDPPAELEGQALYPWLDQIALPLVIHALGGGRDILPEGLIDGTVSCHYRLLPLLYARESDHVVDLLETIAAAPELRPILQRHDPIRRMVYDRQGRILRAGFDQSALPSPEAELRKRIKSAGLWMR